MRPAVLRPGQPIYIRGERWRVVEQTSYDHASIVTVDGNDACNGTVRVRFVLPYEPVHTVPARRATPRLVTAARWQRTARAHLASATPNWTALRAAAPAAVTIMPYQLEPVLTVTRGDCCRVLIADEVGLGKTIQAGFIVAETLVRTPDPRVLIVAPAGLRDQWRDELRRRFAIEADVMDAAGLARSAARVGPDVNPWSLSPVVITSIDYVKRPDVMRSLEGLLWDVVVFDEAHALSRNSDKNTAASALATRARVVVMLTATPHSGDDEGFERLCNLGNLGKAFPVHLFRRTRTDVGLARRRRSVVLRVQPTAAESAMHAAVTQYARLLVASADTLSTPAAALVGSILVRRACSSAGSLARSVERRLSLLGNLPESAPEQRTLPFAGFDGDEEPGLELGGARLRDIEQERRWLHALLALAHEAARDESKARAVERFLRRARQPAIVFTEFRDTLVRLASALSGFHPCLVHGGLTRTERREALQAFGGPDARLLLATDAASEGLNLHPRCHVVISLDVPWTPTRAEQRVGRVDRIGQPYIVHAVQVVAAGSEEEAFAARLDRRHLRAFETLRASVSAAPVVAPMSVASVAIGEALRLETVRTLASNDRRPLDRPVMTVRKSTARAPQHLWAFRLEVGDSAGHPVMEIVVGMQQEGGSLRTDAEIDRTAAAVHSRILRDTEAAVHIWRAEMIRRELAIVDGLHLHHARIAAELLQPSLFDGRNLRVAAAQTAVLELAIDASRVRLAWLDRLGALQALDRVLLFGIAWRP